MTKLLYVPLRKESLDKLIEVAQEERRRPQEQAAYILENALRKAGAKPDTEGGAPCTH